MGYDFVSNKDDANQFCSVWEDQQSVFMKHHFVSVVNSSKLLTDILSRPNVKVADFGCCAGQLLRVNIFKM
jgi:hypothetical protein